MIQPALFRPEAQSSLPASNVPQNHGVVYTKPWVVELILDLAGYTPDKPLHKQLLIEPSAGHGSFLRAIVQRLVDSARAGGVPLHECRDAIVAFELNARSAELARNLIRSELETAGARPGDAELLADTWVRTGDYLLESDALIGRAHYVVGNPPYIRLENLPEAGAEYRKAYPTMVGRADVYVAFYEAALRHLRPGGVCGFICADRWMFNQYGAALRAYVTAQFDVAAVLPMHEADAFEKEVSAYPAITVIRRSKQQRTLVATLGSDSDSTTASRMASVFHGTPGAHMADAGWVDTWFQGSEPWPLLQPAAMNLLRRLEDGFPTLKQTGATVGIGVATGADKVFLTKERNLVEPDRLLPLAMARDVKTGKMKWSGHYLVNPWDEGGLVRLESCPRMATYFKSHADTLEKRHVGKKNERHWYRTIDRVNMGLLKTHKLYLPDFKGRIAPVVDYGETYPHHNLYFITPGGWDVEVLGGLLLSFVAQFFIEAYGVRMRGGYLRFQAQYLRRLRVPWPSSLNELQVARLKDALQRHDIDLANEVATEVYGLTALEERLIGTGSRI